MGNSHWADASDETHVVLAEFGDGTTAWTTIEHAADALAFIDRERGIADLYRGTPFRSAQGTMYRVAGIPVTAEPGSLAGRILGL